MTLPLTNSLNEISDLPKELRSFLRRLGAKVGNPVLPTTTFTPPKGWTTWHDEQRNCDEVYDTERRLRMTHYRSAIKLICMKYPESDELIPTGYCEKSAATVIHTRYFVLEYAGRFTAADRATGRNIGHLYEFEEDAEGALAEMYPDRDDPRAYWDDELPTKWWHSLLFWRRNRDDNTPDLERRLQGDDSIPGAMTVRHGSNMPTD